MKRFFHQIASLMVMAVCLTGCSMYSPAAIGSNTSFSSTIPTIITPPGDNAALLSDSPAATGELIFSHVTREQHFTSEEELVAAVGKASREDTENVLHDMDYYYRPVGLLEQLPLLDIRVRENDFTFYCSKGHSDESPLMLLMCYKDLGEQALDHHKNSKYTPLEEYQGYFINRRKTSNNTIQVYWLQDGILLFASVSDTFTNEELPQLLKVERVDIKR